MIEKIQAIALRCDPVANTSRIVNWLTRDGGRRATMIKGSQRPKSFFLGQYDLFYTCELVLLVRPPPQLHLARECWPLERRPSLRTDWKAAACASQLCDLIMRTCPPEAPHPGLYDLLEHALDDLAEAGASRAVLVWYELKILEVLGHAPRVQRCLSCRDPVGEARRPLRLSLARGGILCARCAAAEAGATAALSPDTAATLIAWQKSASPRLARRSRLPLRRLQALEDLVGRFLTYHLDLELPGRDIAIDLMAREVG